MTEPLRKGIDHIGVCVVYFCHDGKGNHIMAKRSANSRDEVGRWDIGGGAVEHGDDVLETLRREIKEEYLAEVEEIEFLGYRDVHRENNGQKTHWIGLDFRVRVNPDGVGIGEPHKFDDLKWFTLETIPSDDQVHSQFPKFRALYKDKLV